MSYLIWALLVLVGVPLFFLGLAQLSVNLNEVVGDTDLVEVPVQIVPGIPAEKLRHLKQQVELLGFTDLLGYHSQKATAMGMTNYIHTLASRDGQTYADVCYIRPPWYLVVVTALLNSKNFHLKLIAASFYSAWDEGILVTTPTHLVVSNVHPLDRSQVLPRASVEQLYKAHQAKLVQAIAERGAPKLFRSVADYRRHYSQRSAYAYSKGPKSLEEAFEKKD